MPPKRVSQIKLDDAAEPLEVRVLKRWIPYLKEKEKMVDLCYQLVDIYGDAIEAVTHVNNAEHFDSIIKVQQCYIFDNYVIFPQRQYMPSVPHVASLKFGKRATFTPLYDKSIPTYHYSFATYDDLAPRLKLPRLLTDYIGRVENVTPIMFRAGKRLRKLTIQDESCNQIEITLWGEKADLIETEDIIGQVFTITAAIVTEFNKLQLESSVSTTIALNPSIPELQTHINRLRQLPPLPPLNHINIIDLKQQIKNKTVQQGRYTCTAKITAMHEYRGWFYAKCPKCSAPVYLNKDTYVCLDCEIDEEPIFRYCLNAKIDDKTDDMEVVFYDEALNDFLKISCRDMVLALGNKDPKLLPDKIISMKKDPKLLHIAVRKNGSIAVNKAQDLMQPATPDLKKTTTKRALPQSSDSAKKPRILE